ncbi:hypothetical protein NE237_019892 [Protea cynaroides]|uniref:Uncharacterized protein n=1 Tax=Protea cynaroides TaxID=273540 RepID=A0A9Q0H9K4_9MAGN|nr:hypothetical protein NE237_019892 [Protea cynaroides]
MDHPSIDDQTPLSEENATPDTNPSTTTQQASALNNATNVLERKPDLVESFLDSDIPDYREKYKKYEADYVRHLKAKYFSKNNLYGGAIFIEEVTIDDEIIKSSRWPCTWSSTDSVQNFEDQSRFSASAAETSTNHPNSIPM